jgi:hypothetical protein
MAATIKMSMADAAKMINLMTRASKNEDDLRGAEEVLGAMRFR